SGSAGRAGGSLPTCSAATTPAASTGQAVRGRRGGFDAARGGLLDAATSGSTKGIWRIVCARRADAGPAMGTCHRPSTAQRRLNAIHCGAPEPGTPDKKIQKIDRKRVV